MPIFAYSSLLSATHFFVSFQGVLISAHMRDVESVMR